MTRIERLAALLQEPLLVAGPPYVLGGQANVRYLTGLQSSNSALLVELDGSATLYADFRYAKRAREVEGVSFVETPRNLVQAIAELLGGRRVGFEEANLPFAGYRVLQEAGVDAVPSSGVVESLRAV
jgi:Xaa-Pro aminopeptidase